MVWVMLCQPIDSQGQVAAQVALQPAVAANSPAVSTNNPAGPTPEPTPKPDFTVVEFWCALALAGLALWLYILWLRHLEGPPMRPPPPPPVPTNMPPGWTNSGEVPFPAVQPAMPTNWTPARAFWLPANWLQSSQTNLISNADLYDITSLGYLDTNGTSAAPVNSYGTVTVSNLASSTDLITWSNYTLQFWFSTNGVETVLVDGGGEPVMTNYSAIGATTAVPFGIWVEPQGRKFFRLSQGPPP
jgi:hypothetical protein